MCWAAGAPQGLSLSGVLLLAGPVYLTNLIWAAHIIHIVHHICSGLTTARSHQGVERWCVCVHGRLVYQGGWSLTPANGLCNVLPVCLLFAPVWIQEEHSPCGTEGQSDLHSTDPSWFCSLISIIDFYRTDRLPCAWLGGEKSLPELLGNHTFWANRGKL